jgi:predicted PurR-regulated permease PerM
MWNNFSTNKSAQFLFVTNFFDKLGIKVLITDIEATVIDQNTVHLDVYANQDLAPIVLALIVIAIIVGIVMAPSIINAINNLTITLTKKSVDTALLQYANTINTLKAQAINQCLSLTDPAERQKCLDDVNKAYSSLPSTTDLINALNQLNATLSSQSDKQKKEADTWKLVALASLGLVGGTLLTRERK